MNRFSGSASVRFNTPVNILARASVAGKKEAEGPLGKYFDITLPDALWGEKSFEKCEQKMFKEAVKKAAASAGKNPKDIRLLLGGDLLNQIVTAGYSARDLGIPFLGIYGACSTMSESLLIGSMLIDGGMTENAIACTSSHFATAERQYRMPLELGTPKTPTSQTTVTGAGATLLCASGFSPAVITGGTIGRVVDLGINDSENMGAAMAPAAAETIYNHLSDFNRTAKDYDCIITGDLGYFGSDILTDILKDLGQDITPVHMDCGKMIFDKTNKVHCGGSGCGCSAITLNGYFLSKIFTGELRRILFVATGALLSPTVIQQGESIPSIAHAVVIERRSL